MRNIFEVEKKSESNWEKSRKLLFLLSHLSLFRSGGSVVDRKKKERKKGRDEERKKEAISVWSDLVCPSLFLFQTPNEEIAAKDVLGTRCNHEEEERERGREEGNHDVYWGAN